MTPTEVIKILEKKSFVLDGVKGSHHIYLHPHTRRRVIVPLHRRDLAIGTLMSILQQAGIDRTEIQELR